MTDGSTVARDMTKRYQIEEALRENEEQFHQITQNLQHVLWIRDLESEQIIYVSNAFEKIWGRSIEQVYTRPRMLFADVHPDDRERINSTVQKMWQGKHEMNEEYRLLRSDGQIRWLWTRTFPIRNNQGNIYRMGGVTEDITLRKEDEYQQRLSEEKFRMLFESSPIGLGLINHDYQLIEVNPAFCDMLDYSRDELTGKSINEITHPNDRDDTLKNAGSLFNGAITSFVGEKRYIRKGGESVWARLHGTIIRDRHQKPLYGLGMIENIDQLKQEDIMRSTRESAQKKALVREIHHRIKNNLQGVVGLMRQNAQKNNLCSDIMEEAIAQINVVATIHGLQGKESGDDIDLLQVLIATSQALIEFHPSSFSSPIKITGNLTLYLNRDESVPIALALNELMVNAAKHGDNPMEISLHCSRERAIIRIENKCSTLMTQLQPGLGLELVYALLQTDGIEYKYEHGPQYFFAEISLTTPIIQQQRNVKQFDA